MSNLFNTEPAPFVDGSLATVWHEGSRSFYQARLIRPLSKQDVANEEPLGLRGLGQPILDPIAMLHNEVAELRRQNEEIAALLLNNDQKGSTRWAENLLASLNGETKAWTVRPIPSVSQVLKGTARRSGDGFKDETKKGHVVFVWNQPLPSPYAEGQYPRVDNSIMSASTDTYDFEPATVDEAREAVQRGEERATETDLDSLRQRIVQAVSSTDITPTSRILKTMQRPSTPSGWTETNQSFHGIKVPSPSESIPPQLKEYLIKLNADLLQELIEVKSAKSNPPLQGNLVTDSSFQLLNTEFREAILKATGLVKEKPI